jgi:hypothetical protein
LDNAFLQQLADKSMTKEDLLQQVKQHSELLPDVVAGVSSPKAAIRYGCAKVLLELSEEQPEQLYPFMDVFLQLLDSKHRILLWNALAILANLAPVDVEKKFDAQFNAYYRFLADDYMVTVANVVGHSGKIAAAKPYLIPQITNELLKVEHLTTTPHLTDECKRVIMEKAIAAFTSFMDQIERKEQVISFVERQRDSPRKTLSQAAEVFLKNWRP